MIRHPDNTRIINKARNKRTESIPLYEHDINRTVIEVIIGKDLHAMYERKNPKVLDKMFKDIANFHIDHGYNIYSFEECFTEIIQGA